MIDSIDKKLLTILQQNCRISNAEIGRQLGMAPSAIHERIRKLETRKVLVGWEARVEPRAAGLGLLAFVNVRTDETPGHTPTAEALAAIPEVQEIHHIAGEDCYLVKVRAADAQSLGRLLRTKLGSLATVTSTRTTIVLETIKDSSKIPFALDEVESD
jgi:Lrp/AsnC family leucine-responsive transcriptional regulator